MISNGYLKTAWQYSQMCRATQLRSGIGVARMFCELCIYLSFYLCLKDQSNSISHYYVRLDMPYLHILYPRGLCKSGRDVMPICLCAVVCTRSLLHTHQNT
jgi:hypothetical protein